MSCLYNARGGGTGPLSGGLLKLGLGWVSPRAQRSAQTRPAHRPEPYRARTGPKCRAVGRAVVPQAAWLSIQSTYQPRKPSAF